MEFVYTETPEQRTAHQEREHAERARCTGYQTNLEYQREREFIRCRHQAQCAVLTALGNGDMSREQAVTVLHQVGGFAHTTARWECWLVRQGFR